jgi:hypothetical protein
MQTAILTSESESDFNLIIELSKKLNLRTRVLKEYDLDNHLFQLANESALTEWLSNEEDEAWKNL